MDRSRRRSIVSAQAILGQAQAASVVVRTFLTRAVQESRVRGYRAHRPSPSDTHTTLPNYVLPGSTHLMEAAGRFGASPARPSPDTNRDIKFDLSPGVGRAGVATVQARAGNISEVMMRAVTPSNHPAAAVVSPDSPASVAFLAKNRSSPEARAAFRESRCALPAAGLAKGADVNSSRSRYANWQR